jgi:hypothetical protein
VLALPAADDWQMVPDIRVLIEGGCDFHGGVQTAGDDCAGIACNRGNVQMLGQVGPHEPRRYGYVGKD